MKLVRESLNENLGYKSFLGKEVSHQEALQKQIRDHITHIITQERGISEKGFSDYDSVMNEVKHICEENSEIYEKAEEFFTMTLKIDYESEEPMNIASDLINLAKLHSLQNNNEKSVELYTQARDIFKTLGNDQYVNQLSKIIEGLK